MYSFLFSISKLIVVNLKSVVSFFCSISLFRQFSIFFYKTKQVFFLVRKTSLMPYTYLFVAFFLVLCVVESLNVWQYRQDYVGQIRKERAQIEGSLHGLITRMEAHGKFIVQMMASSQRHGGDVFNFIHRSPIFLKDLIYQVSLEETKTEILPSSMLTASHLTVATPFSDHKTYIVLRASLDAVQHALGLHRLSLSLATRSFDSALGPFSYPSRIDAFWPSFIKERGSQTFYLFWGGVCVLVLYVLCHGWTLISMRSLRRDEIRRLQNESIAIQKELISLKERTHILEEEKALKEEKRRLEKPLKRFVGLCRTKQISQISTCVSLLKGGLSGQYDMDADEIESTLDALTNLTTQLEGGEVNAHTRAPINVGALMTRIASLLQIDFKRNDGQMILDPSLAQMTLSADERAMEFFLYAFFKEMLESLFTGTSLTLSKNPHKDLSLCVTIEGTYMRDHLSFLSDTIDLEFTRLSKKGLERMARRLNIQCQTTLEGCVLSFSQEECDVPSFKKKVNFPNVIPLFA